MNITLLQLGEAIQESSLRFASLRQYAYECLADAQGLEHVDPDRYEELVTEAHAAWMRAAQLQVRLPWDASIS